MHYDFENIDQLCKEIGFPSIIESAMVLKIQLSPDMVLCFQNSKVDEDCLVGFEGTPWHTHDDFMFSNAIGAYVELGYLDIITGLNDGKILVCERLLKGKLVDRWLIHRDYNDFNAEVKYMTSGEELKIIRAEVYPNEHA